MDISPWIPASLAMGSVLLCLALLWLMPRPDSSKTNGGGNNHSGSVLTEETHSLVEELGASRPTNTTTVDSLVTALSSTNILLIIPVFLVGIFRYTTLNVLIQYASVRFGLKLSRGATFYTETAIVNMILFLVVIPRFTAYLRKEYKVRSELMDLIMVRTSVLLMCAGSLAIGLAPSRKLLPLGK